MNTALDQVLEAERTATEIVETAETAAAKAVADARSAQTAAVAEEKKRLESQQQEVLAAHDRTIETEVNRLAKEGEAEVARIDAAFTKKHPELLDLVKQSLT